MDIGENDICYMNRGEVTTENRYAALTDHSTEIGRPQDRNIRSCPDSDQVEERNQFVFDDLSSYISVVKSLNSVDHRLNNYNVYVKNNKNNLNTGYYPDIIYLESDNFSNTYDFNHKNNPFMYNGRPIRQVSNPHSKYNNKYYLKMKSAHRISQHIFNAPPPQVLVKELKLPV